MSVAGREFKVIAYDEPDAWAANRTGVGPVGNTAKLERDGARAVEKVTGCEAVGSSSYGSLVDVVVDCGKQRPPAALRFTRPRANTTDQMRYIATFHIRGNREQQQRSFSSLNGALRFLVRGTNGIEHFPGEILDERGRTVAPHEWILDHRAEIERYLDANQPPSDYPPVRSL